MFDATLSSEKGFIAQSLQDLVVAMMSNPEVMAMLQMDVGAMIKEVQALRTENLSRFKIQPPPYATLQIGLTANPSAPAPTGGILQQPALPALPGGNG